ncbi:MAG: oligopeptide transporter, OPT family [Bacteroidetes bacterium]|nr:oligopeptide transporter, OPT family [Bacteroidota bacterium]MDA1119398.1 oligopeptide transporter, OPT family [Bacteroidota bacterium]
MEKPYIDPQTNLKELTVKAVVLGVVLSVVLAGANAYLGLFAGMTVSASIPAAVISMAILRLFKEHNILENNIVQTSASAGESLAAGVIFTFPALVLMGYWENFHYLETALIALCGGVLGVLFTIPLRTALIVKQKLKFPEGVATAEVLKSGEEGGSAIKVLVMGSLAGALVKFFEAGFKIWEGIFEKGTLIGNKGFAYFGMNLSPALIAVGYIVGIRIAILVFAGGVISWWIGIPIIVGMEGADNLINEYVTSGRFASADGITAPQLGAAIWTTRIRFLGVGSMVVGGLWALINLRGAITMAVNEGLKAFKENVDVSKVLRTEQDTPMKWVIIGVGAMIVPIFIIYLREIEIVAISGLMAMFMVVAGFLFASVAGYMAGLVGSSNNPISGVTIATILTSSLILLALLGTGAEKGPAAAILIGSVVCCAAAIAGDNMQDLKAGHILGATPRKQQIMQMVGVVAAAFVLPLILELLNTAYGFGPKTLEHPDSLSAPQATLMQSVAVGVFGGGLPWGMVYVGMALGVLIIIADKVQEKRGSDFRIPVLAVAVGLYLPFELDSAIMLGGLIAWMISVYHEKQKSTKADFEGAVQNSSRSGLLIASGLITGEALVGIFLAIPVAIYGSSDVLAIVAEPFGSLPGLVVIIAICYWVYKISINAFNKS